MGYSPAALGGASATEKWSMNETEIGYNLEKTPKIRGLTEAKVWKLNIPKLMPLIPVACWKDTKDKLSKSIFANAPDCMPVIQTTITTRNYIEVTRPRNCSFTYKFKPHRMRVEVNAMYRNIDDLRITNTIDESVPK